MPDTHHARTAAAGLAHARRGSADPVKALLHRHRTLCERAVDPLEIAAGLEAHGITDRTAARFRHRDVFSLAEELYARAPQGADATRGADGAEGANGAEGAGEGDDVRAARAGAGWAGAARTGAGRTGAGWAGVVLLPGAVASLTLAGLEHSTGQRQLAIGLAGALALSAAVSACLRRGPLRAEGRTVPAAGLWTYALLAYLLCGDGLLAALLDGGPHGPWPATGTPLVTLAVAVAPAAWCARLFSVRARRGLTASRGLADFAARARPLLLGVVGLYACVLAVLTQLTNLLHAESGALAPTVALGTLFLLARLLAVHGFPESAATGLATACALELLACASVLAGRIPGCDALATPVRALVHAAGTAAVPALACGAAALGLLVHAAVALSRASAHT
ncbi:hypothetical protein ACIBJC_16215 [Streptomyces sp. NPDC050509]|uniref:hypothetical protein n=1 Tax=Streptomyces sp. NPDC050509 TaxID=3365620 RepID=UPI0037B9C9FD